MPTQRIAVQGAADLRLRYGHHRGYQLNRVCQVLALRHHYQDPHLREGRSDQILLRVSLAGPCSQGTSPNTQAKNFLDGSKLYESICKMNIYYSNFTSVDLKH